MIHFQLYKSKTRLLSEPDLDGGEAGIRTLDTLTGILDFESSSFDHSDTSPYCSASLHEKSRSACSPGDLLIPVRSFVYSDLTHSDTSPYCSASLHEKSRSACSPGDLLIPVRSFVYSDLTHSDTSPFLGKNALFLPTRCILSLLSGRVKMLFLCSTEQVWSNPCQEEQEFPLDDHEERS